MTMIIDLKTEQAVVYRNAPQWQVWYSRV